MGQMKDFLITVHNGGDEAVAAVQRVSGYWRAQLDQAATEIERLRLAVRELLDGVNARCQDKNPREWTCPHMAALDRLVPPVDDERHDATDSA